MFFDDIYTESLFLDCYDKVYKIYKHQNKPENSEEDKIQKLIRIKDPTEIDTYTQEGWNIKQISVDKSDNTGCWVLMERPKKHEGRDALRREQQMIFDHSLIDIPLKDEDLKFYHLDGTVKEGVDIVKILEQDEL